MLEEKRMGAWQKGGELDIHVGKAELVTPKANVVA